MIRPLSISASALFLAALIGQAAAQTMPHAAPQPIGAGEIFDALTRPDAPSDLQRLRVLRDSLTGNPDPRTLSDMRAQVDTLLRDAEHREGEVPPALVMSGIASRIDGAMSKLENTRPAPPAETGPPWLLPALAALAGTLAVGLAVCLAAMAAQARSAEDSDELRETLTRIRRKLEDVASGARSSRNASGEFDGETADTLQDATDAVTRLNSAAKEADTQLRASTEAAQQRMQGAVAAASQLETWLEQLPTRLQGAFGRAAGEDYDPNIPALADQSILLPDFLSSLQEACDEMRATTEALAQANLAAGQAGDPARASGGEISEIAALASEMTNLSYGHALKLDDVIARLLQATHILPDLARILEAMAQLPQQVERNAAASEGFEAASVRAEAITAQLGQFVGQRLPEELSILADTVTGAAIAALGAASTQCVGIAELTAQTAADLPASMHILRDAAASLVQAGTVQQAALDETTRKLAELADLLPEAGASLAASSEALKKHVARDVRREAVSRAAIGEISAAAQSARADLAAAADAVAAMPAQTERLAGLLTHGEQLLAGLEVKAAHEADALQQARNEALTGVEMAIGKMQLAAERLHAGADAQEQALARVRRAAMTVATLAGAEAAAEDKELIAQSG